VLYPFAWDGLIFEPPKNTLDASDASEKLRIISKRKEGKQETGSDQVNRNDRNK
jgi:hypothetical protein